MLGEGIGEVLKRLGVSARGRDISGDLAALLADQLGQVLELLKTRGTLLEEGGELTEIRRKARREEDLSGVILSFSGSLERLLGRTGFVELGGLGELEEGRESLKQGLGLVEETIATSLIGGGGSEGSDAVGQ